ncbi:hypothetical protein [Paenibacillus sp. 1P07SE]
MDAMAIYLFFFGMMGFLIVGLLLAPSHVTIPIDDEIEDNQNIAITVVK